MTTSLLSIGTRVTHFDGSPGTHGKGTIVAYNGIKPNQYVKDNFKSAVELAAGAGLLNGLVNSMYDGQRCPYVVQWDPRNDDSNISRKYPDGYKDVYEPDSINELVSSLERLYIVVGSGGFKFRNDGQYRVPDQRKHVENKLYKREPFLVLPIDKPLTGDVSEDYLKPEVQEFNGVQYLCYYGKYLAYAPQLAKGVWFMSPLDFKDYTAAAKIIYGNEEAAFISELGISRIKAGSCVVDDTLIHVDTTALSPKYISGGLEYVFQLKD